MMNGYYDDDDHDDDIKYKNDDHNYLERYDINREEER